MLLSLFLCVYVWFNPLQAAEPLKPIPDKLVVLSFDDGNKSDIEERCQKLGIAKPVSFCYPGYQHNAQGVDPADLYAGINRRLKQATGTERPQ